MACQRCTICGVNWPAGTQFCLDCGEKTWYSTAGTVTQAGSSKDVLQRHGCDSCGAEVTGFTKTELAKKGWRWNDAGEARCFVTCDECEAEYAERRLHRAMSAA